MTLLHAGGRRIFVSWSYSPEAMVSDSPKKTKIAPLSAFSSSPFNFPTSFPTAFGAPP
jgi:hypothetical protein